MSAVAGFEIGDLEALTVPFKAESMARTCYRVLTDEPIPLRLPYVWFSDPVGWDYLVVDPPPKHYEPMQERKAHGHYADDRRGEGPAETVSMAASSAVRPRGAMDYGRKHQFDCEKSHYVSGSVLLLRFDGGCRVAVARSQGNLGRMGHFDHVGSLRSVLRWPRRSRVRIV
jgi:hypothetical protein